MVEYTDAQAFERDQVSLLTKRDPDFADLVLAFQVSKASGLILGSDDEAIAEQVVKRLVKSDILQARVARKRAQAAARTMPDFRTTEHVFTDACSTQPKRERSSAWLCLKAGLSRSSTTADGAH